MKPLFLTAFTALLLLISCNRNSATTITAPLADTVATSQKNAISETKDRHDIYANADEDSLLHSEIQRLLLIDLHNANDATFSESREMSGSIIGRIQTSIAAGKLFNKEHRFALIKQTSGNGVNIKVYKQAGTKYGELINYEISEMEFMNDTIMDVNNDGFNDLIIDTYGCCGTNLKGFSEVYLYKPDDSGFTQAIRLDNPVFFPAEKVVRGVSAGQPGQSSLYKMVWKGTELKPVETISLHPNKKHRYILEREGQKPLKIKEIPAEYKTLKNLYWFLGEIND